MEKKKLTVLVLGSSGMAGHTISLYFQEKGHIVFNLSSAPTQQPNNIVCDAFDTDSVSRIISKGQFDSIINCIGLLNNDAELNKSKAVFLNSYLPHFLVEITKNTRTKVIHMSTDCVFSGTRGSYYENDYPDGRTFYDRTKALGEYCNEKDLVFRNSIIGPDTKASGIGLFNWFMNVSGSILGFSEVKWTGVTTLKLAEAMEFAILSNLTGLYHLVNNSSISKYDLLNLLNKYFRNNSISIQPVSQPIINKSLVNTRSDFPFVICTYEEMILELSVWVQNHSSLYPHYFRENNNEV